MKKDKKNIGIIEEIQDIKNNSKTINEFKKKMKEKAKEYGLTDEEILKISRKITK